MTSLFVRSLVATFAVAMFAGADWPHFRGADNTGAAPTARLPVGWSAGKIAKTSDDKDSEAKEGDAKKSDTKEAKNDAKKDGSTEGDAQPHNIAWKAPLVGRGVSSPIVVDGRVIVTASSGFRQDRLHVLCFSAATGEQLWERQFWATGRTLCHPTSAVAANTPTSDGKQIYALFSSNDLVCLDLDGNLRWYRGLTHDFPTAANDVGMSSSPLVIGDTVIVQIENKGDSFAAGLDTATGQTRWKQARQQEMNWVSPALLPGKTREEDLVLLQSPERFSAHRPSTGEEVWSHPAKCSSIPSAVASGGVVYVPAGGLTAMRYQRSGAEPMESPTKSLWTSNILSPGQASPVVYRGRVYALNGANVLLCGDAATGEVLWKLRLKGPFWATPVAAGEHLYFFNQEGIGQVVRLGQEGTLVGENELGEPILASPAVDDDGLYVRSDAHLWKISER